MDRFDEFRLWKEFDPQAPHEYTFVAFYGIQSLLKKLDFVSCYFCKRLEEKTFVNNLPHTNIEIGDKPSSFHLEDW